MEFIVILSQSKINSLIRKVLYGRMPTEIRTIGMPKKPLSMAH